MKTPPLIPALLCLIAAAPAWACEAGSIDRNARVVHVYDGDTVKLAGGEKVRLLGLDTPELARDERPAEPLAGTARDALRALIDRNPEIGLQYGRERRDRYDRLLAHLVLADGRHATRVLLDKGLATLLVLPPNTRNADCYAKAQRRARERDRGLWALPDYRPVRADALESLDLPAYRLVRGTIAARRRTDKVDIVTLAGPESGLKLMIRADVRDYFGAVWPQLKPEQELEVQGWINPAREGGYFMRVRHPSALQIPPP